MRLMPGILFPHSTVPESMMGEVIDFFGDIKVFQPWYMEPGDLMKGRPIEVNHPPERLKPERGFQSLLSEYRKWAGRIRDKSLIEISKWSRDQVSTENTTWEIRGMLNRTLESVSGTDKENTIKYHLILHLAGEIEEQHAELDGLLKDLRKRDSLLKGSIEKVDERRGLLEDLPLFEQEPVLDDKNFEQILRAWIGLFGEVLHGNEPLITFHRHVLDTISGVWESAFLEQKDAFQPVIQLRVPYTSQEFPEQQANGQSGSTGDEKLEEIKDLIFRLHEDPVPNLKKLDSLCRDFHRSFPLKSTDRAYSISLKYLYPFTESGSGSWDRSLNRLSNRALILIAHSS
jgi:hypothetical protein